MQLMLLPVMVTFVDALRFENEEAEVLKASGANNIASAVPRKADTRFFDEFQHLSVLTDIHEFEQQRSRLLSCPPVAPTVAPATSLEIALNCSGGNGEYPRNVNFFATADKPDYETFLPLYAFFALQSNSDSVVEIVTLDRVSFIQNHVDALVWLLSHFGEQALCVRQFAVKPEPGVLGNTLRYLEVPTEKAVYTYIGDIDIFLTGSVVDPMRLEQMSHFGLPYSNIIRPGTQRLTGLMLVVTEKFYTPALMRAQHDEDPTGNDEEFLYRIVMASGLGLPGIDPSDNFTGYRPMHGLHLSTNRGPGTPLCQPGWPSWNDAMSVPFLGEFLCNDAAGFEQIWSTMKQVFEQVQRKCTGSPCACADGAV